MWYIGGRGPPAAVVAPGAPPFCVPFPPGAAGGMAYGGGGPRGGPDPGFWPGGGCPMYIHGGGWAPGGGMGHFFGSW